MGEPKQPRLFHQLHKAIVVLILGVYLISELVVIVVVVFVANDQRLLLSNKKEASTSTVSDSRCPIEKLFQWWQKIVPGTFTTAELYPAT